MVLARRKEKRQSLYFAETASRLYFKMMKAFNKTLDGEFGSFSIISRRVIDAFLQFQDRERHYLFILKWVGFRSTAIDYEQACVIADPVHIT